MPAKLRISVRHSMRLIDRVFEGGGRGVVWIPQHRGLVGGNEKHLAGVAQCSMDDTVNASRPAAWNRLREGVPSSVEVVAQKVEYVEKPTDIDDPSRDQLRDVSETQRELPL